MSYVTEDEAKNKWCPHARVAGRMINASANRLQQQTDNGVPVCITGSTCIGSHCMFWRWGPHAPYLRSSTPVDGWDHIPVPDCYERDSNAEFWQEPGAQNLKRRPGWCGIAGEP